MAKPPLGDSGALPDTRPTYTRYGSGATDSDLSDSPPAVPRKRPRASSAEVLLAGDPDDGPTKTRRVNPQRLASRLDPNLVEEMEAHIIPGAKMPPFDVRKDLQERYNVDRRHIYDYFHSRGLRVAKEDKHINLLRVRSQRANMAAAAAQVPSTAQAQQPKAENQSKPISPSSNVNKTGGTDDSALDSPGNANMQQTAERLLVPPLPPTSVKARKKIPKVKRPRAQDVMPSTPPTPPLTVDDQNSSDQACPEFTFSEDAPHSATGDRLSTTNHESKFLCSFTGDLDDLYDSRLEDIPLSYPDNMSPQRISDPLMIDEQRPLTREEGKHFYDLLDKNLVPTQIFDSQGRIRKLADTGTDVTFCSWISSLEGEPACQLAPGANSSDPFRFTYLDDDDPLSPHNLLLDSVNAIASSTAVLDPQESPRTQEQDVTSIDTAELSTTATCQPSQLLESPESPLLANIMSSSASSLGNNSHTWIGPAVRPRLRTFSAGGGI